MGRNISYAFDVDPKTFMFNNRRVFSFIDAGGPDGIQVDSDANVYVASGDGVQVSGVDVFLATRHSLTFAMLFSTMQIFRDDGVLLGKVFIGSNVANMAFAGDGRLVVLANDTIYLAQIATKSALVTL